jgi:UDP-GlcNAc:undecaprenyl-phosphate GlcNAc-1-phosphate transferase
MTLIVLPFAAFLATILAIFALRPVARSVGLVDRPNERSSHRTPTPLVGGLAMYIAISAVYLTFVWIGRLPLGREDQSFFLAGFILIAVGVADDYKPLSWLIRIAAQVIASLLMIYGADVVLADLGAMSFFGNVIYMGWLSVPFTVFATLGVINALNMSDGLDGLSGSLALISLFGLFVATLIGNAFLNSLYVAMLAAAVLGFLMFNLRIFRRHNASVFMGDAGSMFLGFSLTWFAISLSQGPDRVITPASALWFMMLPIFDTVAMIFRRVVRRRSPFLADKEHIHHLLRMAGFSVNESVTVMAAAAMIGSGIGLLSLDVRAPEFSVAGLFVVAGLLYLWMILRAWKVMRFIERSICRRENKIDRRNVGERRSREDSDYSGLERRFGQDRRLVQRRSGHSREEPTAIREGVAVESPVNHKM